MARYLLLLRWLLLRPWRRNPVRQCLTVLSIGLGVALFLATELTMGAVEEAVQAGQKALAAGADLTVSCGSAGLTAEELGKLRQRPEFAAVAGSVQAQARRTDGDGQLTLLGVEPAQVARILGLDASAGAGSDLDLGQLALDPRALVLTREGLLENGVQRGAELTLLTARGRLVFIVAGVVDAPPAVRQALKACAFLPLAAAQRHFGRQGKVDRVDLKLALGVDPSDGKAAARACVTSGASIATPAERTDDQLAALSGLRAMLVLESLLALLVALFFIYNTVAAAVADRTRDAGLLRCLGLTRGGLRALLLGEAACAGLLGLCVGTGLGFVLGRVALKIMVTTVGILYLQLPPIDSVRFHGAELLAAAAMSIGLSVVAATLASRSLTQKGALEFLRPVLTGTLQVRGLRRAAWLGVALLAVAVGLAALWPRPSALPIGRVVALTLPAGIGLLAPYLVVQVVGWLRFRLGPRASVPLLMALDATRTHPTRTAMTVTAFALSLGLVIGHGGVGNSMTTTLQSWLRRAIPGDVILGASFASAVPTFPIDSAVLEPLRALPGVVDIVRLRGVRVALGDRYVMCLAIDLAAAKTRSDHHYVAGERDDAVRRCVAGEAVIVAENLAYKVGLRLGDKIPIPAADGTVQLEVAGIIRDYNSPLGTVYMDYEVYRRLFHDSLIDFGELCLTDAAKQDLAAFWPLLAKALPEQYHDMLHASAKEEFISGAIAAVEDLNSLSFVQIVLASLIGSVGIMVTVTLSVLARRRELALLRAVGMDVRGLRRTVLFEVAGLAAAAAIVGLVIGNLVFVPANLVFREFAGFQFDYVFPAWHCVLALVVAGLTAVLSAVVPLRRVQRMSVLEAVEE